MFTRIDVTESVYVIAKAIASKGAAVARVIFTDANDCHMSMKFNLTLGDESSFDLQKFAESVAKFAEELVVTSIETHDFPTQKSSALYTYGVDTAVGAHDGFESAGLTVFSGGRATFLVSTVTHIAPADWKPFVPYLAAILSAGN